ncbi:MAG: acetolactate synthase 2 catalytic subunit [Desulfobacterales bacterium]|nr:acetolactate synthase 2 catalytic subunit [Desulfobacterales bacterium]
MRGVDLVIQLLKEQGVDTVFGFPGGAIMPMYDALYDSGIRNILPRHEQGAAFAAVGYARASGKTAVCICTSGPGATNIVTGIADALLDSVPLVAITGQVASPLIGTDAFQEIDVLGMSLSITKHSFLIRDVSEISDTFREAFRIAASDRPGPVLIDIPRDIQLAPAEFTPPLFFTQPPSPVNPALVAQAAALLRSARRPVLYVGGGVGMACAITELRRLSAQTQIPSVTTLKGIGTIPPNDPNFLGMVGMHGNPAANKAVQQCDLLLCVGARFDDRVTGKLDTFASKAKVIHLDVDAAEINKIRSADVGILGDLCEVLPMLACDVDIAPWQEECRRLRETFAWRYDMAGETISAPLFLKQLSDAKPAESIVSCDVGQHQMWVAQHMRFDRPEKHLSSGGLGTMGFGLPAAIGAQIAKPGTCVINVAGDGSFMMNVQELATLRRYRLPVKIVLMDNQRLGMVKQWQQMFFEKRYSETILWDNPDFVRLAEVFDIPGRCITKKSEVAAAIKDLLEAKTAYLLQVKIDHEENVWPLVPPGAPNDEMLESA